ncbi:hypothetical protein LSAT2_017296 [Lamellibrachia satsuma]|nr:hypothetical protein LSAT2_017296 [Lamellibrachia satsuma]
MRQTNWLLRMLRNWVKVIVTQMGQGDCHTIEPSLLQPASTAKLENRPASRNPVDLTIEQTINRHANARGGLTGFSRSYPAYRHARASYVEAKLEMTVTPDGLPYVDDGNALLHALTALSQTFGELSKKLLTLLPKVRRVDFVTDINKDNSIKSAERRR